MVNLHLENDLENYQYQICEGYILGYIKLSQCKKSNVNQQSKIIYQKIITVRNLFYLNAATQLMLRPARVALTWS